MKANMLEIKSYFYLKIFFYNKSESWQCVGENIL